MSLACWTDELVNIKMWENIRNIYMLNLNKPKTSYCRTVYILLWYKPRTNMTFTDNQRKETYQENILINFILKRYLVNAVMNK